MCGIVGVAGDLALKDEHLMRRLFLLDYFRGTDSTGLAAIRENGDPHLAKIASHPLDLFDMERFKKAMNGYQSKAFLGHNRAATKGNVNALNAHPYECGHIIGVHNGTLSHQSWTDLKKAIGEDTGTDSHAVFIAIQKLGLKDTMELMQGAWSLVWYDRKENSLNFLRNKERPMWYAFTENFDRMIWASEWAFIDAAMKMNTTAAHEYKLLVEDGTGYKYWSTDEDTHYRFDMDHMTSKKPDKGRPKPTVKIVKGKDAALACGTDPFGRAGNPSGFGSWMQGKYQAGTGGATTIPPGPSSGTTTPNLSASRGIKRRSVTEPNIIELFGDGKSPLADVITKEQFDGIAKYGCSWCGEDVAYEDVGITVFERDDIVLCAGCTDHGGKDGAHSRIYTQDMRKLL